MEGSVMWPMLAAGITGGASLLGSIFSSDTSAKNTQEQIQASMQEQQTQNAFSEQMSNTAYQRASSDMKSAGLNPAMMFGSGSAASSPTGSSIQAPMPQKTAPLAGLGEAAKAAISSAVQAKEIDRVASQVSNLDLDAERKQKLLDLGEPEKEVDQRVKQTAESEARTAKFRQQERIDEPEAQLSDIRKNLPSLVKNALVGSDTAKSISSAGTGVVKDILSLIPGGKWLWGGSESSDSSAQKKVYGNHTLSPSMRQGVKDAVHDAINEGR